MHSTAIPLAPFVTPSSYSPFLTTVPILVHSSCSSGLVPRCSHMNMFCLAGPACSMPMCCDAMRRELWSLTRVASLKVTPPRTTVSFIPIPFLDNFFLHKSNEFFYTSLRTLGTAALSDFGYGAVTINYGSDLLTRFTCTTIRLSDSDTLSFL